MGRIFLVAWNQEEVNARATDLRRAGWQVETEHQDGARAYRLIKTQPPDAVIIDLSRLPSHGRETAHALRGVKATRQLPIIFIDGTGEAVEKTKAKVPGALFTNSSGLLRTLSDLRSRRAV